MRIAVITSFIAGERINFFREVALVKSASLYADTIEVLSFSSLVYTDWGAIAPEEAEALRRALIAPHGVETLPKFTTTSDRISADSGVNELLPALREDLIRINDRVPSTGDVWGAFIEEIVRYLSDPDYVVLLDDRLSGIVADLIAQGRVTPTGQDIAGSSEAVLGAGLIARLPSFTEIPMNEVLDLRRDLEGPLVRYRSAVAGLRSQELDPYSPARDEIIDLVWRQHVAPALLEIEEDLKSTGLYVACPFAKRRRRRRDQGIATPIHARRCGWERGTARRNNRGCGNCCPRSRSADRRRSREAPGSTERNRATRLLLPLPPKQERPLIDRLPIPLQAAGRGTTLRGSLKLLEHHGRLNAVTAAKPAAAG